MILVTLEEKGGGTEQLEFEKNELTIGRLAGNDLVLAKGHVSKSHAKIIAQDGRFIV
ncbi:MAG: FHA domain-containing protein, partial [Archangium sp.]